MQAHTNDLGALSTNPPLPCSRRYVPQRLPTSLHSPCDVQRVEVLQSVLLFGTQSLPVAQQRPWLRHMVAARQSASSYAVHTELFMVQAPEVLHSVDWRQCWSFAAAQRSARLMHFPERWQRPDVTHSASELTTHQGLRRPGGR